MPTLLDTLTDVLSRDESLLDTEGHLLRTLVTERADRMDAALLERLLADPALTAHFFTDAGPALVFDAAKFREFVANKAFLPDSFTAFANTIGLVDERGALAKRSEVVLAWPYKDCVLEGGMTKEDAGRKEVFWNTVLAPDEVTCLFEPKALTGFERWDADAVAAGEAKPVGAIEATDNLLIKGNNLLALHSLKRRYAGQVKLIYIDPPYNTGGDGFRYNDRFNHSAWLTFMRNRLEVARELLRPDGSIFVNLDDGEAHYAKVLVDEVFGRDNFVANVIWQKKYAPANDAQWLSDNHDHVFVYARSGEQWSPNDLERSEKQRSLYGNRDDDNRGDWKADNYISNKSKNERPNSWFSVIQPNTGEELWPSENAVWRYNREQHERNVEEDRVWWGTDGANRVPALKRFITEVKAGVTPQTIWLYSDVGHTQEARRELNALDFPGEFTTPKPERLLQRILHVGSDKDDLVLDFFAGSGTTAAVAHKMGRRWIAVEQMDYARTLTATRLKKVIEGEGGGISKAVGWEGGGSFVYCELADANDALRALITQAGDDAALADAVAAIKANGFLRYRVTPLEAWDWAAFDALPFDDRRQLLLDSLDHNHLHVNVGNMADPDFGVSEADQAVTAAFYEGGA